MSLRFQLLGSSSRGNCALIESSEAKVLLDVGFSGRRIEKMLKEVSRSVDMIDAVLLTHEHGDHIAGMRGLSRFDHLEYYANEPTARAVQEKLKRQVKWKLFQSGSTFQFRDLSIETIRLPHDAYEPVGYIIRSGDGTDLFSPQRSVAWLTDLGFVPAPIAEKVSQVDLLILEANHDSELLELDEKRPYSVKQRISGRHGHLSNNAALDFLLSVPKPYWRKIMLAHISRDCNCLNKVREVFEDAGKRWPLEVIDPEAGPGKAVDLMSL